MAPADLAAGDIADAAQEKGDRDLLWAELGNEANRLAEVDSALQRIRDGTYGYCETTGKPIPADRLRAIPWTRHTVEVVQPISPQNPKTPPRRR